MKIVSIVTLICFAARVIAAELPPNNEAGLYLGTPHPALLDSYKVDGYDYIEATFNVEEKGASVSWAPFLYNKNYRDLISETRFQIGQKDNITSLGFSLRYNPRNPRSSNGLKIGRQSTSLADPYAVTTARQRRVEFLKKREIELLTDGRDADCDIHLTPDGMDALRKQVEKVKGDDLPSQLVAVARCVMHREPLVALNEEIEEVNNRILNQEGNQQVLQVHLKDLEEWKKHLPGQLAPIIATIERAFWIENTANIDATNLALTRVEISTLQAEIDKAGTDWASSENLAYLADLQNTRIPIVTVSYVDSYFKTIAGDYIDVDEDGLNDIGHRLKSSVLSIAADVPIGPKIDGKPSKKAISLLYARSRERDSSEEGSEMVDYNSFGITWLCRLKILNPSGYQTTADYKESLFIPSINFGVAYERRDCKSSSIDCLNGILRTEAITPFFDFKISKAAQFRIGIPFKRNKLNLPDGESSEKSVELISEINFQLGSPK